MKPPPVMVKSLMYFSMKWHELVLELVVGGDGHHVIHKQSKDNEVLTLTLHENSLLTIYHEVAVRRHPCGDVLVPSACNLSGTIDDL